MFWMEKTTETAGAMFMMVSGKLWVFAVMRIFNIKQKKVNLRSYLHFTDL